MKVPIRYLALGDSYTAGTGASGPEHAWPSIVVRRLRLVGGRDVELTNPAVNGFTTEDLIEHELPLLDSIDPDLVTVLIGVNDLVQGRSAEHYRDRLSLIYDSIASSRKRTGHVAAISIPAWWYVPAAAAFGGRQRVEELTMRFNEVARLEAGRPSRGFTWIDITRASMDGIGSAGWIAPDDLHPGDAQYATWAEVIFAALSEAEGFQPSG